MTRLPAVFVALVVGCLLPAAAPATEVVELSADGVEYIDTAAVNTSGEVAGTASFGAGNPDTTRRAFRWQLGPGFTNLGVVGVCCGFNAASSALDINNAGLVAGSSTTSDQCFGQRGVVWTGGAATTLIDAFGSKRDDATCPMVKYSQADAINDAGLVAGSSPDQSCDRPYGRGRAFVAQPGSATPMPLPTSCTNQGDQARDINAAGDILILSSTGGADYSGGLYSAVTGSVTPLDLKPTRLNDGGVVVGTQPGLKAVRYENGTYTPLPPLEGLPYSHAAAVSNSGLVVGHSTDGPTEVATLWRGATPVDLNTLLPANAAFKLGTATDISDDGRYIVGEIQGSGQKARSYRLHLEDPLSVTLEAADVPNSDLVVVRVTVKNEGDGTVEQLATLGGHGIAVVPGVFPAGSAGQLALFRDSGGAWPSALASGASASRTFAFLSVEVGKVLLRGEFTGKSAGADVRDAEYAELSIEPEPGTAGPFAQMAAMQAFTTGAHNSLIDASRRWAEKRVKQMNALRKDVRKRWLGSAKGKPKIRLIDRAMAHMHGISPEEYVTQVPRGDVIKKGGAAKIAAARRAVTGADSPRAEARAEAKLGRVIRKQTLTSSESMAAYNRARIQTDNNVLWELYDEHLEKPAKDLYKAGGGTMRYLLQFGSYEGQAQIEMDLIRFAELTNRSIITEGIGWVWAHPIKAYEDTTALFRENVEEAEVARARREQFKRNLYVSDPEKAIFLQAQDDSFYLKHVLGAFIEAFDPTPGPVDALRWAGKQGQTKITRASIMAALSRKQGDKLAGRKVMEGVEDLGEGVKHADDFVFPSADPDELLKLDQLGKKGGAGMREQRIAEQINREMSEQLQKEFPHVDLEVGVSYKTKKNFDPVGSLPKPQAFSEKILDPRSIQVLGAPPEALGKKLIFKPTHPLQTTKGWDQLPAIQKRADIELYKLHLDQWLNLHKRNPAGKTGDWKKAVGQRHKIEFGGGHTVELELELHPLGKDALEVRAKYMAIDGTVIHDGKPLSIGSDWDPLVLVNAKNAGKKLEGEIERRALEIWNQKAVKAQKEFGFRSGGHGATMHGDDVTPQQWTKFARLAGVTLNPVEQLHFEALVAKRAGLPVGTKIFPAALQANEHVVRTTVSDTYVGPLGQIFD